MEGDRNERYSEYLMRKKPREQKLAKVLIKVQEIFEGSSELQITESAAGDRRVRAFVPDEDGYAGWIENASWIGLAEAAESPPQTYVAERYFPNQQGKPVYLWKCTPTLGELGLRTYHTTDVTAALDIYTLADDRQLGYFHNLVSELRHAFRGEDYERRWSGTDYQYVLPELQ